MKVKLNNKDEKIISLDVVVVIIGGYGVNKDMIEKECLDLKGYVIMN